MARILLIDDDRNLREVVKFILADKGHEILEAADGEEGLRQFAAEAPDLVLTDIRMPGRDGMEVLRQIRTRNTGTEVPVIVLTAYGTVEQAVELLTGLRAGERDEQGEYTEGSLNRRVEDRLLTFAELRHEFRETQKAKDEEDDAEGDEGQH